jgi:hypothetical protein
MRTNTVTSTSRWDSGLDWNLIPRDIISPTKSSEKLWETVARLGNDFYTELVQPGVIAEPAGGTVAEAMELQKYTTERGLTIGHYFDTAITQALHDRGKVESPESFMLSQMFGDHVKNPDDQNPAYGAPGEEQELEGSPEDAGIDSRVVGKALDEAEGIPAA